MAEQTPPVPAPAPAPTPPATPGTPAAPALATPVPAKSGSKAWLIVLIVILAIIVLCCGGTALAWFIARQTMIDWADSLGVSLEQYADEIEDANNDANNADDEDETDEDGSSCITFDGEDGTWYIENDFDDDGKIDTEECEPDEVAPTTGFVTGTIYFPSEFYPDDLEVCAEEVVSGDLVDCVSYEMGTYSGLAEYILELPEGDYYIYGQTDSGMYSGYKAYYNEFVECGMAVGCNDHTPIEVTITAGDTEYNVSPSDWYDI